MKVTPMTDLLHQLTAFLAQYDLGKLDDPSLKTSDIAKDLLNATVMQELHMFLANDVTDEQFRKLPAHWQAWVLS